MSCTRSSPCRAKDTGKFSAPAVDADDYLPLMAAVDVAKAANIILQKFDQYANEVSASPGDDYMPA